MEFFKSIASSVNQNVVYFLKARSRSFESARQIFLQTCTYFKLALNLSSMAVVKKYY